jgi:hypothetical protein
VSPGAGTSHPPGDTLALEVDFRSETNEIEHNVSVRVQARALPDITLYAVQSHVHRTGSYEYRDFLVLKDTALLNRYQDWLCIASVWSHDTDAVVRSDSVIFRVAP